MGQRANSFSSYKKTAAAESVKANTSYGSLLAYKAENLYATDANLYKTTDFSLIGNKQLHLVNFPDLSGQLFHLLKNTISQRTYSNCAKCSDAEYE